MNSRRLPLLILLLIILASAVVFARLWHAPFLTWDDDSNISANPYYQAGIWAEFWKSPYYGLYVPLTSTIWQVLYTLGAGAALPYRILNSVLHSANIVLVYFILRRLSLYWRLDSPWAVLAGVGLFAFHPLQVETVAWISGGRDLLATTCALSTILVYYRGDYLKYKIAATALFAAAMLSKPNSVVLPALIFAIDLTLNPRRWKSSLKWAAIWLALAAAPVWMIVRAQAEHLIDVDLFLRPWIVLDTYSFYLRKLLWPWPLAANYARTPDYVLSQERTLWIGALFLAALIASTVWAWRRDRRFLFSWCWLLLLLPVSGVVPFGYQKVSTPADHYHYLPMLVVGAVVMLLLEQFLAFWRRPVLLVTAGIGVALFAVTWTRVPVWASNRAFFEDMADYNPNSFAAAIGMSIVSCVDLQDYNSGVQWTNVALSARPNDILALANQAYCFLHAKNYIRVTELEYFLNRIDLDEIGARQPTGYASFLASIGTAEMELGHLALGFQYLCEAFRVKPSEPSYGQNLKIATRMLEDKKLDARCDPNFAIAPADEPEGDEDDESSL